MSNIINICLLVGIVSSVITLLITTKIKSNKLFNRVMKINLLFMVLSIVSIILKIFTL